MTEDWALQQAMLSLEQARKLTRERGQMPTSWSLTLLWLSGRKQARTIPAARARTLTALVRRVREVRRLHRPTWLFTTGRLVYTRGELELPHLVVVLVGAGPCVLLYAGVDTDGNPCPPRVNFQPDPGLLGPLARLGE